MDFDLSVNSRPQSSMEPLERPAIAALRSVAASSSGVHNTPALESDQESEDERRDDEWRIATGKRGRDTPSPIMDPALKMLRTAIDQMPPGATDLFGDPVLNLPPPPPMPTNLDHIAHSNDLFGDRDSDGVTTADFFDNPFDATPSDKVGPSTSSASTSINDAPGLLRDDGGIEAWMNRKPRKGKEKARW